MYIFMAHIIVREVAAQVAGKALSISLSLITANGVSITQVSLG